LADVFLSYRNLPDRRAIVARLAYILDAHKISVWWDYGLDAGDSYREQITREMAAARIVMPLWCEESVASPWVLMEAELGKDKLFPARLQAVAPPTAFEAIHAAHLESWDGDINSPALMDYLRRICVRLGKPDDLPGFVREQLAALPRVAPLPPPRSQAPRTQVNTPPPAALWSPIAESLDPRDYEDFLTHHPGAEQSTEARKRLRQLTDWAAVDTADANAVAAFRAGALEKSKLFPALDAHVVKVMRRASAAQRKAAAGSAPAAAGPGWRTGLIAAGALVLAGGAGAVFMDPFGWFGEVLPAAEASYFAEEAAAEAAPAEEAPMDWAAAPAEEAAPAAEAAGETDRERALREQLEAAQRLQTERDAAALTQSAQQGQALADQADDGAWQIARSAKSVDGYEAYLARYPYGRNAASARTELTRLKAFNPDLLQADVRAAVLEARNAATTARANAAEANRIYWEVDAKITAFRTSGTGLTRQDIGDATYEVEVGNGKRSGLGAQWMVKGPSKGAVYRGQWALDQLSGYGVMDFAAATGTGAGDRYEGSFAQGSYHGGGVYKWKNGNVYAGQYNANIQQGYGVMTFPDGSRYEGQWSANRYGGYGVMWNSDGTMRSAGRWSDSALVQALNR
jgi:hypothetical protein